MSKRNGFYDNSKEKTNLRFYPIADPFIGRIIVLPLVKDSIDHFIFPLNIITLRSG
jgi:hypothetical protein